MSRFLTRLFGKTRTIRTAPKPRRPRLGLEALGDRIVPATVSFNPSPSLFQMSGRLTEAFSPAGDHRMTIALAYPDSISAAAVSDMNAAAGNPNAFIYTAFLGRLSIDTDIVRNVSLSDTGNDLVTLGSTAVTGNLSVSGGAIALVPGGTVSTPGNIQLNGWGTASTPVGVSIPSGATVQGFAVTITGFGATTAASNNAGVLVNGGTVAASHGGVTITGYGGGTGNNEDGIDLWQGAAVTATGSGKVALNGYASGSGRDGNFGICVTTGMNSATDNPGSARRATQVSTVNGSVALNGTGSGSGQWNDGVTVLAGGVVQSTGTGSVSLTGTSGRGTNWNEGILISGSGSVTAAISGVGLSGTAQGTGTGNNGIEINHGTLRSGPGGIYLSGTGSGSGYGNSGVAVYGGSTLWATSIGAVTVSGNGSAAGTYNNMGVFVSGAGTRIDAESLTVLGYGAGTGSNNYAVTVSGGAVLSSAGSAAITGTCTATGPDANFGVNITDANTVVGSSISDLTIVGRGSGYRNWDYGIGIQSGASVLGHAVTLAGTGSVSAWGTMSAGVFLSGANVTSYGGNVLISGTAGTSSSGADGVSVNGSQVRAATAGYVDLIGSGGYTGAGVALASGSVAAPSGRVTAIGVASNGSGVASFGAVVTGGSVGTVSLTDRGVFSVVWADFLRDWHQLGRNGMKDVFAKVVQDMVIGATESQDLDTLINSPSALNMPGYVQILSNKVAHPSGSLLASLSLTNFTRSFQMSSVFNTAYLGLGKPADGFYRANSDGSSSWVNGGTYSLAAGGLWGPSGGPVYTDVQQRNLGDCSYLAAMADVAYRNPQLIRDMFIDNGDGTYTVRFLRNGQPDYVTVDKSLPSGGGAFAALHDGALWVALAEKALVIENAEGWLATAAPGVFSYGALDGGNSGTAASTLSALTGRVGAPIGGMASDFARAIQNGAYAVLGTGKNPGDALLVGNHAYAVLSYDWATDRFLMYNPWGDAAASAGVYGTFWANSVYLQWHFVSGVSAGSPPTLAEALPAVSAPIPVRLTAVTAEGANLSMFWVAPAADMVNVGLSAQGHEQETAKRPTALAGVSNSVRAAGTRTTIEVADAWQPAANEYEVEFTLDGIDLEVTTPGGRFAGR
ncbi:MAG: peptidase calpain [Gemmataceae bacterium]|nr:peptidase calpain [Gemmataceae bacterium]